jgi:uncharacterized protein (TIGR01777 family)
MELFITGATGLIGRRLALQRLENGDRVRVLSRDGARASQLFAADANPNITIVEGDLADPASTGWTSAVDGCDAVINLAGENISAKRWTPEFKDTVARSRVDATRRLVEAIGKARNRPRTLVNASAVGIYGDHGERIIDEEAPLPAPGEDFLSDLCREWEAEAERASELGIRVVRMRTGLVLDDRGGGLPIMMRLFRWMIGGRLGSGKQYMSWIHHRDLVALIAVALRDSSFEGPINAVAPKPVTNREFARALGRALDRPRWLPAPTIGLRLALGEIAKYVMMSQRVIPRVALDRGFHFMYPELEPALSAVVEDDRRRRRGAPAAWRAEEQLEIAPAPPQLAPAGASGNGVLTPEQMFPGAASAARVPAVGRRLRRERPAARIKLVAIDVDGTMLSSDGRLAQGVIDACRAAARVGVAIVPATARPPRSMQSILGTLGTSGPTINYNGAVIWNPLERRAQYHEALEPALVRGIIDRARELLEDVVVSVEILDKWFTDRVDPNLHTETSRAFDPDYIGSLDSFLDQPVTKLMLLAEQRRLLPVIDMVREEYWSRRHVSVFVTDPHMIQIAHPLVDKGIALQRIARKMGAAREEVMAIGDGPNDAGMVEWAGFSVAMENGCEMVKSLADQVVPSNDDLGVAKAIHRFVLR